MSAKIKKLRGKWRVVVHGGGGRRVETFGPSVADRRRAEQRAREENARLALGLHRAQRSPATAAPTATPFAAFAAAWYRDEVMLPIEREAPGALSWGTAEIHARFVKQLVAYFGETSLREIRATEVASYYASALRERQCSPRSAEMGVATLSRIFVHALACELIDRNPVEVWKRTRGRRRRSQSVAHEQAANVLSSGELAAFLGAAHEQEPLAYPLLLFLADTGARVGEALALRWVDVNLASGTARIARSYSSGLRLQPTKTGRVRTVELSGRLRAVLAERRPDLFGPEALVFPNARGGLLCPRNWRRRVFDPLVARVFGAERHFTPHGLRHTFATLHLARGTPIKWIQSQGGWSGASMLLDVYGHHIAADSRGFADALASEERAGTSDRVERVGG